MTHSPSRPSAFLSALYEEGTKDDCFHWVCKLTAEVDELRAKVKNLQEEHGRRIEVRRKDNPYS